MLTRRRFLTAASTLGAVVALPGSAAARPRTGREEVTITDTIGPADSFRYRYFPFAVPEGVSRVDATIDKGGLSLGFGVFDERGAAYQSPGFRGVFGGEDDTFFLAADQASRSFLPGPVGAGTWTLIVPVFSAPRQAEITITVTLTYGPAGRPFRFGRDQRVVRARPGWFRGDLHCHTPQSSDANASGSALSPAAWADTCRRLGLDYAAMTDHNVISQNLSLAADAGRDVLLLPGEEMTNWFHGHATVSGMEPDTWFDWRQRPLGIPLSPFEQRITAFTSLARELGAYSSAAHPFFPSPGLPWTFFGDAAADPAALPDGIEVWTGPFFDQNAANAWDAQLRQGRRLAANGGSDLHGTVNDIGFEPGEPTTVVYARQLEKRALVAALRAGRSFVTAAPDGAELYLTATGPGGQATYTGGTVYGAGTDAAQVEVLVRRGPLLADEPALRLDLLRDGVVVSTTPITADEQTVGLTVPVGGGGYVRAELRGTPYVDPVNPLRSRSDMRALTNPIWLSMDPAGEGVAETAPPPPPRTAPIPGRRPGRAVFAAAGAPPAVPSCPCGQH